MTLEELKQKRNRILKIASLYRAKNIRVFGSVARNEQNEGSDVDFLVNMEKGTSLLDHIALVHALEDELGTKVDIISETALKGRIKENILHEVVPL